MPAGWAAAAAAVGGALISADASKSAANKQADAAAQAGNTQLQMFNTVNAQNAPYRQSGYGALSQLNTLLGLDKPTQSIADVAAQIRQYFPDIQGSRAKTAAVSDADLVNGFIQSIPAAINNPQGANSAQVDQMRSILAAAQQATAPGAQVGGLQPATGTAANDEGFLTHQFNANDLNSFLAPNYAFVLDQGQRAAKNAGNLQTGLVSGNTMKGLEDYTQGLAGNQYQQAFNNFTANQSNIFNRLATIAGFGSGANSVTANTGTNLAGNLGSAQLAGGAAQAAGDIGSAKAISGGLNNAASWYTLGNIMKNNGGATTGNAGDE